VRRRNILGFLGFFGVFGFFLEELQHCRIQLLELLTGFFWGECLFVDFGEEKSGGEETGGFFERETCKRRTGGGKSCRMKERPVERVLSRLCMVEEPTREGRVVWKTGEEISRGSVLRDLKDTWSRRTRENRESTDGFEKGDGLIRVEHGFAFLYSKLGGAFGTGNQEGNLTR
jgi:hypothetical protein